MSISKAFAYLVHPGKGASTVLPISGKEIVIGTGKLFDMLNGIFDGDTSARDFEITFNAAATGAQSNACRDLVVAFQTTPTHSNGLQFAERLQGVTDNRSGIGLLFLLTGNHGLKQRLVRDCRYYCGSALISRPLPHRRRASFSR